MSFPTNPSNNEQYTNAQGTVYQYSTSSGAWSIVSQTIIGQTGAQGITGVQGPAGPQGMTGLDSGITGVVNIYIDNGVRFLKPTGMLGSFEMPFNYNIYGWDVIHTVGETGTCFLQLSNSTYTNNPPTNTYTLSGYTGAWTKVMYKNTGTSNWTGSNGDIIRMYGAGVTGTTSLFVALKYTKI